MRLRPEQLAQRLSQHWPKITLIFGEETFLVEEAASQVREKAQQQAISERQVWHVEGRFDWSQIPLEHDNLSLFASHKLIEIRLPKGAPGKEGGAWLQRFVELAPAEISLLIISGKIDARSQKSKWFTGLDAAGWTIPIWPIPFSALPQWIFQRMKSRGLQADLSVANLLAERLEGNLFAAAQEIDKLGLLSDNGRVTQQLVVESVADNARFGAFGLMDVIQAGQVSKVPRVLARIRAEGLDILSVLSAISWAVQRHADMALQLASGVPARAVFSSQQPRVPEKSQQVTLQTIKRHEPNHWRRFLSLLAEIDQSAKGRPDCDDAWRLLEQLCLQLTAVPLLQRN
ncbi:DNA polymerase III delta subunit [Methylophaga frappieri]|uniref:DNA polymerase III subunit delta n=1 Tax=Methylophaga frappieri (strain ATCC BAA-2434 / DSM 25690 / JAM7) TaxID=754477 RepID=I1YFS6_METFJ|nr:DNA polymerase III subunit delta [Methylophaga frappieri]AFJ01769.1 DNA polymerase III delta subunit [Methylophaga frappieri]